MTFELPSLRERKEDIIELIKFFMTRAGWGDEQLNSHIEDSRLEAALRHRWPGNIRELENEIKLAIIESGKSIDEVIENLNRKFCRSG